jgi:hypothetical protein
MAQAWARQEMEGAAVWDRRCVRSLVTICERRFNMPVASFSMACGSAARQAAHRICSHRTTTVEGLLRGHFQQTAARCRQAWTAHPDAPVLVVQDTTDFKYTSHRATSGLGPFHGSERGLGLLAHAALALPVQGVPLGLVHLSPWARDPAAHGKRRATYQRACEATALKESQKWIDGLWGTEATLPPEIPVVLIADREADCYDLFAAPRRSNTHLLVRSRHPRKVLLEAPDGASSKRRGGSSLPSVLTGAPCWGTLRVTVPRQRQRPIREAELELRVVSVWLQPAELRKADAALRDDQPQQVWMVEAKESDPPPGVEALHWVLLTTLEVNSPQTAERVVGYYCRRWEIEALHLVLKSGLQAEKLQMETADLLKNTLALLYVVAWRVLQLRDTARWLPETPAEELVTATERDVLEAAEGEPVSTARAVVRAIAHVGGFARYPSAGEPGVRRLWEGCRRLEAMVLGWQLARGHHPL